MHHCAMIKRLGLIALVSSVAPFACGGGGSGGVGVGGDFCAKFATATCQRTFACPDPTSPPPAGFNMSTCVESFTHACTDKPPAGQTSDVTCYGATHVNTAAQTECLSAVAATTCDDLNNGNLTYDDVCSMVCTTVAMTGAAGSGGVAGATGTAGAGATGTAGAGATGTAGAGATGTAGAGATGTAGIAGSAPPTSPTDFCQQLTGVLCAQEYDCVPAASRGTVFQMSFGTTVQECKTMVATVTCATAETDCTTFDPAQAQTCIGLWSAETCAQFADEITPTECNTACPP